MTISSVDYAPEELYEQVPIVIDLLRQIPGDDRPDYWLGKTTKPIRWIKDNVEQTITHVVLAARWVGTQIEPGAQHLPVGIAYVTDLTAIDDTHLDLKKCAYVAIGVSSETSVGKETKPLTSIIAGNIVRLFGLGTK